MSWEVWLSSPQGSRLVLLDQMISGQAIRTANNPGAVSITCPSLYDEYLHPDSIIEVWRSAAGATRLFNAYFLRSWEYHEEGGQELTSLYGYDGLDLLTTRVVSQHAGSTDASASAEAADNLMKRVVRTAMGTLATTDTARNLTGAGFRVASDATAGTAVSLTFAYSEVLDALRDIAEASRQAGTPVFFDVFPIFNGSVLGWEFRTSAGQPGADRTGAAAVTFSREYGNLSDPRITHDYRDEKSAIYVGGRGEGPDRVVVTCLDTARLSRSPWARREVFLNASGQSETTAAYTAAGNAELQKLRPRLTFTGTLNEDNSSRFGVDWGFGDRVYVAYRGHVGEAVITSVTISLDTSGVETVAAGFEVVDVRS